MAENSGIGWTDNTQNFWQGCNKVSAECTHCYIDGIMRRAGKVPFNGPMRTVDWSKPLKWERQAQKQGRRFRVFTCSMSDFFHPGADEWRPEAWEVIRQCPSLDWLVLTKRPELILDRLPPDWGDGYRLGEKHWKARLIRIAVGDEATAKKIRAVRRARYKKVRLDVHCWLRSQFKRLEVDQPLALSLLSGHRRFELVKIPVDQIAYKETEFGPCRYGRVHSSLTRSSRRIRPALHVSGKSLVMLDVANSQPLFMALLVINYRKQGNKTFGYVTFSKNSTNQYKDIDKIIEETVSSFTPIHEFSTSSAFLPANTTRMASRKEEQSLTEQDIETTGHLPRGVSVNRDFLSQDEQHFVMLCEQGKLYRTLKDEMEDREMPLRHWVKTEMFEVLFGSNRLKSRLKDIFEETFPGVAEVIRVHKTKDYRFLPRLLQNIEANFVINGVCRRIMTEMPDAPVYTIHDSILTTRPFVEPIRQIMVEDFARLGLTPTLHEKDYGTLKETALRGP